MAITIIARPCSWTGRNNPGARLRWDAIDAATGNVLATATEFPISDAAKALADRGWDVAEWIVMTHAGSDTEVFKPMPIGAAARPSYRRAERTRKLADLHTTCRDGTAVSGISDADYPAKEIAVCGET